MSAKEDLQQKIQSLKDKLSSATASLNEILIAGYEFQPGDVVERFRGDRFTVSSVGIKYGEPRAWGRKTLKDGSLGNQTFELYGNLTRVVPETK